MDFKATEPNVLYYASKGLASECKEFFDQALGELGNAWLGIVSKERALENKALRMKIFHSNGLKRGMRRF